MKINELIKKGELNNPIQYLAAIICFCDSSLICIKQQALALWSLIILITYGGYDIAPAKP